MIRKLLLSTVAIAAVSTTALAADLPSRRAPPVYVPPVLGYSWTGLYAGGDVGYAFGRDNVFANAGGGATAAYSVGRPNGITGGGHIGYNFSTQSIPVLGSFAGSLSGIPFIGGFGGAGGVVGIEGDVRGSDYRANGLIANTPGTFENHRNEIQGSARGRIGIAVDRALFFATGGAAFASFRNNYNDGLGDFVSATSTRVGWTVGGGVEYAITSNFSLRAEYRYEDFGRYTQTVAFPAAGAAVAFSHRDLVNLATVGFSYKFDTLAPAPVVARY